MTSLSILITLQRLHNIRNIGGGSAKTGEIHEIPNSHLHAYSLLETWSWHNGRIGLQPEK